MTAVPHQFGSPTPVIITDQSGSSGTSANIDVTDAATGSVNTTAPLYANQIGWSDAGGNLQPVSASNPLPISATGLVSVTGISVPIQVSGSGTLVAATGGKKIRVISYWLMANGSVNVKFQSHVSPTDITGLAYLIQNTGLVVGYNPAGWFDTIIGEALDINLSGSIAVGGVLNYMLV